jgi:type IV pilus assembly protein PilM
MSAFATWLASPPADAAIEITSEAIAFASLSTRGRELVVQRYAVEPLPPGAVSASLTSRNLVDRRVVAAALETAVKRVGSRPRRIALLIPDVAARVSLLRFESVPARHEDLEQLVRWQLRKSAPFPIEEAVLTCVPGVRTPDGATEFIAVLARRDIIRDYESLCEEAGMHPGLVDLSTLGVVNLCLASEPVPEGDWLVVHVRPEYTSLAIMRRENMIFFRNLSEGDAEALADVVHQTTMYYQDRLSGQGFVQVLLGGVGRTAGALETARRSLEGRLTAAVQPIDPTRMASLTDRIGAAPELLAMLGPSIGTLLRMRTDAVGA